MKRFFLIAGMFFCLSSPLRAESDAGGTTLDLLLKEVESGSVEMLDLSHKLKNGIPVFPGGTPFQFTEVKTYKNNGYSNNRVSMGEHTATHVDAPYHFHRGGLTIEKVKLEKLMARACVIDIREQSRKNPDYELSLEDIVRWEDIHGPIPDGAVLLVMTGWSSYWAHPEKYTNMGADQMPHFPGLSTAAADFLVNERNIEGVGTDALSVDPGKNRRLSVHRILHGRNKYHIENLNNLDKLPPKGAVLCVFPIAIEGGSGGPTRAVALVEKK